MDTAEYDRDDLRAVGHIGGVRGMKKFVRTKGKYNATITKNGRR